MKPVTFSLQFRGQAAPLDGGMRKEASAPGGALVTSLNAGAVEGRFVWAPGDEEEALFESTLSFTGEDAFDEQGTIVFARGSALRIKGRGQVAASPNPHLRQGSVVWRVAGGEGRFEGASGLITSNFLVSDSGELTENQLGVIFTVEPPRPACRHRGAR